MPAAIISTIDGQWSTGLHTCNITGGVLSFVIQFRNWLMFVFVCDRFFIVFRPFRYNRYRRKVILILCSTVLALSLTSATLPTILGCFSFNRVAWLCISPVDETCPNFEFCQLNRIFLIALGQIVSGFVPMVMYIALFIKAKIVRNQIIPLGTQEDTEQRK